MLWMITIRVSPSSLSYFPSYSAHSNLPYELFSHLMSRVLTEWCHECFRPRSYDAEADDEDLSDHEEEFYYTEVEVTVDTMTQTFADMYTSSPPASGSGPAFSPTRIPQASSPVTASPAFLPDHDYQKKVWHSKLLHSTQCIAQTTTTHHASHF